MSTFALSLILIAAILHAVWNLAAKKGTGKVTFGFQSCLALIIVWAPLNIWQIYTSPESSALTWSLAGWGLVFASAAIHGCYFLVLLKGYQTAPMSVVYPVARGTGPLISSFFALLIFSETMSLAGFAGVLCIVVGVFLISGQHKRGRSEINSQQLRRGVFWGASTGLFIAAYTLVDAYSVKRLNLGPMQYQFFMNGMLALMYAPFVKNIRASLYPTRLQLRSAMSIAILAPAGYILVLYAMQIAPVSQVAPAREVSMMFGAFLGGKILKEDRLWERLFASGLMVVGIWLLCGGF